MVSKGLLILLLMFALPAFGDERREIERGTSVITSTDMAAAASTFLSLPICGEGVGASGGAASATAGRMAPECATALLYLVTAKGCAMGDHNACAMQPRMFEHVVRAGDAVGGKNGWRLWWRAHSPWILNFFI